MSDDLTPAPPCRLRDFDHPDEIVASIYLDNGEKVALLRQWEQDVRQLMTAAREGMEAAGPDPTAELMRAIHLALGRLGATADRSLST
jgi:hypothetical protein